MVCTPCVMWCYPLGLITRGGFISLSYQSLNLILLSMFLLYSLPSPFLRLPPPSSPFLPLTPPSSAYLRAPSGSQEYKFQFAEHSRQNSIISSTPSATERSRCTAVTKQLLLIVLDTFCCSLATPH
jgi:hypothetical protein